MEQIALLFDGKDAKVAKTNPVAENFLEDHDEKTGTTHVETVPEVHHS